MAKVYTKEELKEFTKYLREISVITEEEEKSVNLRKIENCFCSFFVICHGTSGTHIAGLTDAVEEKVREDLD